jgi:hypothetical protein
VKLPQKADAMIMNILVALAGFLEPHCTAMELVNLQDGATL